MFYILAAGSVLLGFILLRSLLAFVLYFERRQSRMQKAEMLEEARKQRAVIQQDFSAQDQEAQSLEREELELTLQQRAESLLLTEQTLQAREESFEAEEKRLERLEKKVEEKEEEVRILDTQAVEQQAALGQLRLAYVNKVEIVAQTSATQTLTSLTENLVSSYYLEEQRALKALTEELESSAYKNATKMLERALGRYEPEFIWPKSVNTVEVSAPALIEQLSIEDSPLIQELIELSGANIQPLQAREIPPHREGVERPSLLIKFAGGFGMYRESARLALTAFVEQKQQKPRSLAALYQKYLKQLEEEAAILGKKAVQTLKLPDIAPEIQRLVGALNWRTSYRQNQWYHTVEVAVLAGILANELGVDPQAAKRVGLLHDIGKALDYNIDGSHAIISGDYADRYGESRLICDTVMSHHDDLVIETDLAYVLKAADTLSGARPGARVHLEEGYNIRLEAIHDAVSRFPEVVDTAIMNGGREVHIRVDHGRIKEKDLQHLTSQIAARIKEEVSYPGQIKVLVTRIFESVAVA